MSDKHGIISENDGFISSAHLIETGNYFKALRAVDRGNLIRVRQGVYATPESLVSNMIDVEKVIPRGIVCLYSAWAYYGLTDTVSPAFCIAIEAKRKVASPDVVPIQIYYWKKENLKFGITEAEISGFRVRITDLERSVCDAIKYRNKIGMDICSEIIRKYISRTDRNLSRLIDYSKRLRVYKTLSVYLDISLP